MANNPTASADDLRDVLDALVLPLDVERVALDRLGEWIDLPQRP